ncbi:putative ssDNA binding protein Ssb3 [Aspergillus ruber CBS 135680]|uniref:Putative ssDNA binding protein Ssb3 n=1 Tax=Aspergillus ruber (strain CBS 135680) TaxID=1388766 RepID=A0A017SBY2_ASPRC|nr:putative ssDNA binding protein Ssb3 [Aspergillus ruber CBS 135680]EYE94129.1 putative ssDNA binding protein Ssb3 [Aspergillus ruber CBS 135680]
MSLQTPRVLPAHLHAFHPSSGANSTHTIRLLGTVSALHGDTATITCGGNGDVTLVLRPDSHLQMGKLVEVVGKVMDLEGGGLGVRVLGTTDWGNSADCDYKIYEKVVEATHKLKSIFYDSNE